MPLNQYNEEDAILLAHQFEEMLRNNELSFFEQSSFKVLIDYYENRHQVERAIEVVNIALEQHPFSSHFYIRKAQLVLEKNDADTALVVLAQAELYDASELELYLLKAEAYSWKGLFPEALNTLKQSLQNFPKEEHDEIYLSFSQIYEDMDQMDKCFQALGKALKVNPKHSAALDRMWLCVELSGKYKESVEIHTAVIDIDPYSHQAWYNLGHAYFCLENYEKAAEAFDFAIVIEENFEFAYRDRSESYFKLNLFEKAIESYLDALEHIKPDADLYTRLGQCFERLEILGTAKEYYLKAVKLDPQSDNTFFRMGECYAQEGYWVSAISAYNKAIKLNGQNADYLSALGLAYAAMEENEKALEMFRIATDLAPEESERWIQFSSFLMELGMYEIALEVIEEAYVYSDDVALDYCQTACLIPMGCKKAALQTLQNALQQNFDLHTSLYDIDPSLKEDKDVQMMIQMYQEKA